MLIIGSSALGHKNPKDLDMIATEEELNKWLLNNPHMDKIKKHDVHYSMVDTLNKKWVEVEIAEPGNTAYKYQEIMKSLGVINDIPKASDEVMFSIKKSHIHFPIKFEKHIKDYQLLLSKIKEDKYPEITKQRFKETEDRIGRKLITPKLAKSNSEFFGQSEGFVKYYFVHDDIHKVMAHMKEPVYTYMQKDETNAFCHKNMWDEFPRKWKNWAVMEEAYVIALERKIIPMIYGGGKYWSNDSAFKWALMRICTTLCGGWFREWATNHYDEIMDMYDSNYVSKFLKAVDKKEIKENGN